MPDGTQQIALADGGDDLLASVAAVDAFAPTYLYIDIETRSAVNLLAKGVYVYAEHPSTAIIILSYALDDGPIKTWFMLAGQPMPDDLRRALLNPTTILIAHNAGFERILLTVVGKQQLGPDCHRVVKDIKRWSCTAARSAVLGLPRSLENVGKALGLAIQKDHEGYNLMMQMCMPTGLSPDGKGYTWREDAGSVERLARYCEVDVAVERLVNLDLPPLSDFEQEVWRTTERMNDRGISVDGRLLTKLVLFAGDAEAAASVQINHLTACEACKTYYADPVHTASKPDWHCSHEGAVPKITSVPKLKAWLVARGLEEADEIGPNGKPKGVGKWMIQKWLDDAELPPLLREVLIVRKEGGKSSTKKFIAIASRMNLDDIIRGVLLYCGAASTSRFSSRGAQLHNLPRGGTVKDMVQAINDVLDDLDVEEIRAHGPPLVVASEMARPVFIAKFRHWLARGDYSQIEARVNAWLAGEHWKIRAFKDYDTILGYKENGKPIRRGPDMYVAGAAASLGIQPEDVSDIQRQGSGKVGELACGFGGGIGALQAMARIYNVTMTDEAADVIKLRWRAANPNIVQFWYDLDNAAIACMSGKIGDKFMVRPGLWFKRNRRALALRVPGGGALIYWYPKLEEVMTPWGKLKWSVTYMAEDSQKHIWVRHKGYGGLFCENVCQKVARDIMADALVRLDGKGLDPRLTVHDEAVCQISWERAPTAPVAAGLVEAEMLVGPHWAVGLPIAVETSAAQRYLKV